VQYKWGWKIIIIIIYFNSGSKAHKHTQAEYKKHNTQHKRTEKHKTALRTANELIKYLAIIYLFILKQC